MKEGQKWLNQRETAEHFGVTEKVVHEWVHRDVNPLPAVVLPGQRTWKVRAQDADRWALQAGRRVSTL